VSLRVPLDVPVMGRVRELGGRVPLSAMKGLPVPFVLCFQNVSGGTVRVEEFAVNGFCGFFPLGVQQNEHYVHDKVSFLCGILYTRYSCSPT